MINDLKALDVLFTSDIPEEEKKWVEFYFNNVSDIRRMHNPEGLVWGQLKTIMWLVEENKDFESCMEYTELMDVYGDVPAERDADSQDEYGVEEFEFEEEISNKEREMREAANEEGPPWDDCDDFELCYRNKGL